MRPDTSAALALSPFRRPVPLPTQDPGGIPAKTVNVACSWLPYIRGALMALTMQYTYPVGDDPATLLAQQRAMTLISMFEECSSPIPPIACSYDLRSSSAGWVIDPSFNFGLYVGGLGFEGTFVSSISERALVVRHDFPHPATATFISIQYDCDTDGSGANNSVVIFIDDGSGPMPVHASTVLAGTNVVETWVGEFNNVVAILVQLNSGTTLSNYFLHQINVSGLSVDPCS